MILQPKNWLQVNLRRYKIGQKKLVPEKYGYIGSTCVYDSVFSSKVNSY